MSADVDLITESRTVLFVGEYFSLVTTVTVDSGTAWMKGRSVDDQAVARASDQLKSYYGWDVAAVSKEIGVIDDAP